MPRIQGRLTLTDKTGKMSRFGVFESIGALPHIYMEKISTPSGEVDVYIARNTDNERLANQEYSIGDVVQVDGDYLTTERGQVFVARELKRLSKCNVKKYMGRDDVREAVVLRSELTSTVRHFFEKKGFLEVSTPVLLSSYEGGDARPFETTDASGKRLFLKETNELILRRLISCGLGPLYEIGRSFRNIGTNKFSLNEFTVVESATPYSTLADGIVTAELLITELMNAHGNGIKDSSFQKIKFEELYKKIKGEEYTPRGDYNSDRKDLSIVLDTITTPAFLIGLPHEVSPINSRNALTLNESVFVMDGKVYCDICEFEVSKRKLEERLATQEKRTGIKNDAFLEFANCGLVPGVGIAFGLERWMNFFSGRDVANLKNLGGLI